MGHGRFERHRCQYRQWGPHRQHGASVPRARARAETINLLIAARSVFRSATTRLPAPRSPVSVLPRRAPRCWRIPWRAPLPSPSHRRLLRALTPAIRRDADSNDKPPPRESPVRSFVREAVEMPEVPPPPLDTPPLHSLSLSFSFSFDSSIAFDFTSSSIPHSFPSPLPSESRLHSTPTKFNFLCNIFRRRTSFFPLPFFAGGPIPPGGWRADVARVFACGCSGCSVDTGVEGCFGVWELVHVRTLPFFSQPISLRRYGCRGLQGGCRLRVRLQSFDVWRQHRHRKAFGARWRGAHFVVFLARRSRTVLSLPGGGGCMRRARLGAVG
ncbi:hypothetical protein C8R44DRAFT_365887 [Mycena epipterygia]|nr:hypothetical protein C8R44DRAFT_365887 [Mycena epipterygia]